MQFAQIAIFIPSVEVIHTISNVASLLNFSNDNPLTNSVYFTRIDKESIAIFHLFVVQNISKRTLVKMLLVLFFANCFVKTDNQFSPSISVKHIPHFRFTKRIMTFFSQFIVRMHLYRKVFACIYKFNKDRKIATKTLVYVLAKQLIRI